MQPFGHTRTSIQRDHALITPDTHVESPPLGWRDASAVVHISPHMGARFTQYTALMQPGATSGLPADGVQRFIYVADGAVRLSADGEQSLTVGHFAFLPADVPHEISVKPDAPEPARLVVFEKPYEPLAGAESPNIVVGHERDVAGEPFQGDPAAVLQTFLPIAPEFDMAVNLFTYQPGANLPQVEVHVMEHGLIFLDGAGVYRLGDCWYPVAAGDVIWMASYCPQWFVAMGKTPARYLYYKDIHREPAPR
jgi:(S)-ureidoglycine aminohydrolase